MRTQLRYGIRDWSYLYTENREICVKRNSRPLRFSQILIYVFQDPTTKLIFESRNIRFFKDVELMAEDSVKDFVFE